MTSATLAKQYKGLMYYCCCINDFSKIYEFEKKYVVSFSVSKIGDWFMICTIFVDGSAHGHSSNLRIKPCYCTHFDE